MVPVIEAPFRTALMAGLGGLHRAAAGQGPAPRRAVGMAAVARRTDRKEAVAPAAGLLTEGLCPTDQGPRRARGGRAAVLRFAGGAQLRTRREHAGRRLVGRGNRHRSGLSGGAASTQQHAICGRSDACGSVSTGARLATRRAGTPSATAALHTRRVSDRPPVSRSSRHEPARVTTPRTPRRPCVPPRGGSTRREPHPGVVSRCSPHSRRSGPPYGMYPFFGCLHQISATGGPRRSIIMKIAGARPRPRSPGRAAPDGGSSARCFSAARPGTQSIGEPCRRPARAGSGR